MVEPTHENQGASWWCVSDSEHCTSHSPCGCCEADALVAEMLDEMLDDLVKENDDSR